MAYPPTIPPANRVDATPQATNHPNDHNNISRALTDIVNELGSNPSGPSGSVQTRLAAAETEVASKLDKAGGTMTGILTLDPVEGMGANAAMGRSWIRDNHVHVEGDVMTGNLTVGGSPYGEAPGCQLQLDGNMATTVGTAGSAYPNLYLERLAGGGADDTGEIFIKFLRGPTAPAASGTITIAGASSVAYNTTSDHRLKEPQGPVQDPAGRIKTLGGLAFQGVWIEDAGGGQSWDMINAHDIAAVAPYAVQGDMDGVDPQGVPIYQQVDYSSLVPLLVSALADALNRIEVLEAG